MYFYGPDESIRLLQAAAVMALAVLPGLWLALGAARRFALDVVEVLLLSVAASIAIAGLVGTAAHYLGLGLVAVVVAYVVGIAASGVVGALLIREAAATRKTAREKKPRKGRKPAEPAVARLVERGGWLGMGLASIAALVSLGQGQNLRGGSDQFYHLAAVRSLIGNNLAVVTDPFFGTTGTAPIDPTSGAWHTVMAAVCRISGIDPLRAIVGFTALGTMVFVGAMWSATRRSSGNIWAAAAATSAFFGVTFSFYFRNFGMASFVSYGLAIFALVLLVRCLVDSSPELQVAAIVVGYATAVVHIGAAEMYFAAWFVFVTWGVLVVAVTRSAKEPYEWAGVARMAQVGAAAGVASLPLIVPRLLELRGMLATGGSAGGSFGPPAGWTLGGALQIVDPRLLPGGLSLAVLGLVLVVIAGYQAFRTRDPLAVLALAAGSLVYLVLLDPLVLTILMRVSPYMAYRLSMLLSFGPFVLIAWGLVHAVGRPAWLAPAVAGAALVLVVALNASAISGPWAAGTTDTESLAFARKYDVRTAWGEGVPEGLQKVFGDGWPTVGGVAMVDYWMAGMANVHIVAVPEGNTPAYFEKLDGPTRRSGMDELVYPYTSPERRAAIVGALGLDFVVLDTAYISPSEAPTFESMKAQNGLFTPVYESGGLVVLKVKH